MNRREFLITSLVIASLLAACNQLPTPTPTPNSISPRIELTTNPSPLKMGDAILIVNVRDNNGKSIEGAEVNISYNMTTMSMGITSGKATEERGGRYTIQANFAHTGNFKFTIQVDKPGLPQGILETKLDVE